MTYETADVKLQRLLEENRRLREQLETWDRVTGQTSDGQPLRDRRYAGVELERYFRAAGLSEASATTAAEGLRAGRYFSFADAALAQTVERGRNVQATPLRIAEVARTLPCSSENEELSGVLRDAFGLSESAAQAAAEGRQA